MILGYYEWKSLHDGDFDLYLSGKQEDYIAYDYYYIKVGKDIEYGPYKFKESFVSLFNGAPVLALRLEGPIDFIPEMCLNGTIKGVYDVSR